jgi:hypothetical protein
MSWSHEGRHTGLRLRYEALMSALSAEWHTIARRPRRRLYAPHATTSASTMGVPILRRRASDTINIQRDDEYRQRVHHPRVVCNRITIACFVGLRAYLLKRGQAAGLRRGITFHVVGALFALYQHCAATPPGPDDETHFL